MKPTLIKRCSSRPNPLNGKEAIMEISDAEPLSLFPDYALVFECDKFWMGIKPGFAWDGISVPRPVYTITGLTPFDQRCYFAGALHDGGYRSHLLNQYLCDAMFLEVLKIPQSPNWIQREIAYDTLRCVGHIAYNSKTQDEIDKACQFVTVIEKKKLLNTVIK
jgi:hypothetical protein